MHLFKKFDLFLVDVKLLSNRKNQLIKNNKIKIIITISEYNQITSIQEIIFLYLNSIYYFKLFKQYDCLVGFYKKHFFFNQNLFCYLPQYFLNISIIFSLATYLLSKSYFHLLLFLNKKSITSNFE